MQFLAVFMLFAQASSPISINKPAIAVTVDGYAESKFETKRYEIILYADVSEKTKNAAQKAGENLLVAIRKAVKALGGKDADVTITSTNTYDPIEGDPYFRIEQDIKVKIHEVGDIENVKSRFTEISGVQIGSVSPIIAENIDYTEAVLTARENAVTKAFEQAAALAGVFNVTVGQPLFVAESIVYPDHGQYAGANAGRLSVKLTVYYEMIYKK